MIALRMFLRSSIPFPHTPSQYRDLPHDAQLALTVMQLVVGEPPRVAAGTTLPLFNKKGRLKTGPRRLRLWPGREPCLRWPSSTPAKVWGSVGGGVGHG